MKHALVVIVFLVGLFAFPVGSLLSLGYDDSFGVGLAWGVIWTSLWAPRIFDLFRKWGMMP